MNDERNARRSINYGLVAALLLCGVLPLVVFGSGERALPILAGTAFAIALAVVLTRAGRASGDSTQRSETIDEHTIVSVEQDHQDVVRYTDFYSTETQRAHFAVAANADYAGDERRRDGRPWAPEEGIREDQVDDISASNDDGWTEL